MYDLILLSKLLFDNSFKTVNKAIRDNSEDAYLRIGLSWECFRNCKRTQGDNSLMSLGFLDMAWTTDFFCAWSHLYDKDPSLAALSYRVPNFQSRSELPTPSPTTTVTFLKYSPRRLVGEAFVYRKTSHCTSIVVFFKYLPFLLDLFTFACSYSAWFGL